ncbi:MAG TPA: hypothetical protein VF045_00260 [Acidimicrobiales bacterium]
MASIRAGLESVEAEVEVPPVAATQSEPSASGPPRFVALLDPTPAYRKGLAVALAEAGFKPAEPVDLREWLLSVPGAMVLLTIIDELDAKSVLADAASANAPVVALLPNSCPETYAQALRSGAVASV